MPAKNITCEFCHQSFRKDLHAVHVRAKHKEDIGKKMFKEATEKKGGYTHLNRFAQNKNATPIYSDLDEDACYIFGVQPKYFEEKDSFKSYTDSQDNVEAHNKFIEECINTLKPTDIFTIIEQLEIKSPEVVDMKRLHLETQKNLMKEIESLNTTITRLERENKAISVCCEVDLETFEETIKNYEYSKKEIEYYKREAKTSKTKIESLISQLDKVNEEERTIIQDMRSKNLALECQLQEMTENYMKLKGKKSDKKAKEKEKRKKEKKKLKKKLESDSDSDSDSD